MNTKNITEKELGGNDLVLKKKYNFEKEISFVPFRKLRCGRRLELPILFNGAMKQVTIKIIILAIDRRNGFRHIAVLQNQF